MAYPIETKEKAAHLRKQGLSLNEVNEQLNIAKGTLSVWLRSVIIPKKGEKRLLTKIAKGQWERAEERKKETNKTLQVYFKEGAALIKNQKITDKLALLLCSLLYWCEGIKNTRSALYFTNSDEKLVRTFLNLFRQAFKVEESKFRVCLHLHAYHNPKKQIEFWSEITKIPKKQFTKPYNKPNSGKRVREGYNGCASIRYHDTKTARKLLMTAKAFLSIHGGIG